jgi:hypothetical protein
MPKRRRSPLRLLVPLSLLALAAFAAWRVGPQLLARWQAPAGAVDVCGAVPNARAIALLHATTVDAAPTGSGAGVPAAGACTWRAGSAHVVALAFTRDSLARAGASTPIAFYASTLTGIEYELKETPRTLPGLGDEAALAGFGGSAPVSGRLVARRGDLVIELAGEGTDADALRAIAAALLAGS